LFNSLDLIDGANRISDFAPFFFAVRPLPQIPVDPDDHTRIGAHLASKWQLPGGLVEAIRWHHEFQPESKNANFVQNIYLANFIVNSYDADQELRLDLSEMHPEVAKSMMDMVEDVADWYSGLTGEIEAAYGFFLDSELYIPHLFFRRCL